MQPVRLAPHIRMTNAVPSHAPRGVKWIPCWKTVATAVIPDNYVIGTLDAVTSDSTLAGRSLKSQHTFYGRPISEIGAPYPFP